MIKVRRLGSATLATARYRAAGRLLDHGHGAAVVGRDKGKAFLATKLGQEAIVLENGTASALTHISFQVEPGSDLNELAGVLRKAGVSVERQSDISPGVADAIAFDDPKGTRVEIFEQARFLPKDSSDTGIGT